MNEEIKPDYPGMFAYDMSIVLRYGFKVRTVILNFGIRQDGKIIRNFGSICYEVQIVDLSGIDGDKVYEELSQKITLGKLLNERQIEPGIFPFMKHRHPSIKHLKKLCFY